MNTLHNNITVAKHYCSQHRDYVKLLDDLNHIILEPDCVSKCDVILHIIDNMKHIICEIRQWEKALETEDHRSTVTNIDSTKKTVYYRM